MDAIWPYCSQFSVLKVNHLIKVWVVPIFGLDVGFTQDILDQHDDGKKTHAYLLKDRPRCHTDERKEQVLSSWN